MNTGSPLGSIVIKYFFSLLEKPDFTTGEKRLLILAIISSSFFHLIETYIGLGAYGIAIVNCKAHFLGIASFPRGSEYVLFC